MLGLVVDIIAGVVAFAALIGSWQELDKYRGNAITYKLAKRPILLWLIILLCDMNFIRADLR